MACPRCSNSDITGKKFGFGDVTLYEFLCKHCDLFEYKKSTDPDFGDWYRRWQASATATTAAAPAATTAAAAASVAEDEDEGEDEDNEPLDPDAKAPDIRPVIAAPQDDGPRLVYADQMAPYRSERAEFIRLQVARSAAERANGAFIGAPSSRESELRQRFGKEWAGAVSAYGRPITSDGRYRGWEFERGFVAQIRTDPDIVIDRKSRLFELAPIEHVDVTSDGPVRALLRSPNLARLRSLDLGGLGLNDDDARVLAAEGQLTRCEWLDLRGNMIGPVGVAALVASPLIRAIPMVMLDGNPSDPAVQYNLDYDGSVMDLYLPPEGQEAEARYGRINWFHLPAGRRPDRFHARAVRYED